jgi:hypothetical protein
MLVHVKMLVLRFYGHNAVFGTQLCIVCTVIYNVKGEDCLLKQHMAMQA